MEYIKNYLKTFLYTIIPILTITLLLTISNYFGIINYSAFKVLEYITIFISIFIASFILGKNSKKKALIEGLKYSLIVVIFMLLLNLIAYSNPFNIKILIYYSMIIATSVVGSIIGINKKK